LKADLPGLVSALSDPQVYPEHTQGVTFIQTQMSCVFLTDEHAYKIKKPVNLGYLDYTTLNRRLHFCEQEIILNQRLCPGVYLEVVAITFDGKTYALGGTGKAIDYAVKMKRLPDERLLNHMLRQNAVTLEMMDALARKLAQFHEEAQSSDKIASFGNSACITQNTEENFSQTEMYIGRVLSKTHFERIRDYTRDFIRKQTPLIQKRVSEQRIRDCHGDLHAQHICFWHDICVFDCIEFNERFRYCDVASEVAFLAMDLEHSGKADISRHFIKRYIAYSGDADIPAMLNFYKCYRAYVRGKVACFTLDDPLVNGTAKQNSIETAQSYFDIALSYSRSRPMLIVMLGMTGSGKTTMAAALAGHCGAVHLSSDVTRKHLAGISPTEHRYDELDTGLYSPGFNRRTYDAIIAQSAEILEEGTSVVLDAAFLKHAERKRARAMAQQKGADMLLVECRLSEQLTKERLEQRTSQETASDGRWEVYLKQLEWMEPVESAAQHEHIIIDTSLALAQNIRQVLHRINNLYEH